MYVESEDLRADLSFHLDVDEGHADADVEPIADAVNQSERRDVLAQTKLERFVHQVAAES